MNSENIRLLRNLISEGPDAAFDMNQWFDCTKFYPMTRERHWECGTVGCIGGWTALLMYEKGIPGPTLGDMKGFLGLSMQDINLLFYSYPPTPMDAKRNHIIPWKRWMLARIDDLILHEKVRAWPEMALDRL